MRGHSLIPRKLDRIFSSSTKDHIVHLYASGSWMSPHQLKLHLYKMAHSVEKLESLLENKPNEASGQRMMATRNTVLGDIYFDPNIPFADVQNMENRLASKGVLNLLNKQMPEDYTQFVLNSNWKVPIADLVIGCSHFPETANNSPLGCQQHISSAQMLVDPNCVACFRSAVHKLSSDIFNHHFMFRCINSLGSNKVEGDELHKQEPSSVEKRYPNLARAIYASSIPKVEPLVLNRTKIGIGWKCDSPSNQSIAKLREEFMRYGENHLTNGWTWIVFDTNSNCLEIVNTPNNICVLSYGMWPLLAVDLWEHAFSEFDSLKNKNDDQTFEEKVTEYPQWSRAARRRKSGFSFFCDSSHHILTSAYHKKQIYIQKFWKHVNWKFVEEQIQIAKRWKEEHSAVLANKDHEVREVIHDAQAKSRSDARVESIDKDDLDIDSIGGETPSTEDLHERLEREEQKDPLKAEEKCMTTKGDLDGAYARQNNESPVRENFDNVTEKNRGIEHTLKDGENLQLLTDHVKNSSIESDLSEEDLWSEIYEKSFQRSASNAGSHHYDKGKMSEGDN